MKIKFIQKIIDILRHKKPPVIIPEVKKCGKCSYVSRDSQIWVKETEIGSFCSISDGVRIGLAEHPVNCFSTSPYTYSDENINNLDRPVIIGNDVWIGSDVLIKSGINIGDGAILAAGAIVTKDVPPYAIVGGVPAKIIKYRFDEETIKQLLELKWWDLPDKDIKQIPFTKDITQSIEFMKKYREKNET